MSKHKPNFPDITVAFSVTDIFGRKVHEGEFRLSDDTERRAFGQRCNEAMRDGFIIHSCRKDIHEAQS